MKWMKWLKWTALAVLLVLILIVAALSWVLGTQSGLHFALNSATRFVPGLEIRSIDGDINNLTLAGVKYQMPGVDVDAEKLHLALRLGCLTSRELCIDDLSTENVIVNVDTSKMPPSEETPPSEPLTELNAPLTINLNQLQLTSTKVNVDRMAIDLEKFKTGIHWQQKALTLAPMDVINLAINLPVSEEPQPDEPVTEVPVGEEKSIGETLKELFAKPLLAELPEVILPVDLNVEGINGSNLQLTGATDVVINSLNLTLSNDGQNVLLKKFTVDSPQGHLALSGTATLADKWPVSLSITGESRLEDLDGQKVDLSLKGGLLEELKLALNLSGPVNATLAAQADLAQADLPIQLTLESQKLSWPLVGDAQYQLDGTRLRLNGRPSAYDLSLRSAITGQEIPPSTLMLDAKGNEEQVNITRLRLAALQGNADITGVADWSKAISWNAVLTLSGINTAKQWPEWPAKVDGKIATRGSLYGGSWQLQIPEITLDGNVKNNLLKARGEATGNAAGQWNIPELKLSLGKNHLDVKGNLSDKWNLDTKINAPGLDGILPGLGGVIIGDVKLRGDLQAPEILADLTARGVRWQKELSVDNVVIKGKVASGEQIKGDLSVVVRQLKQADLVISRLTLDAKGSEKQHTLKLDVSGEPVSGHLTLAGGFDRQTEVWKGNLSNTLFETPVGEWKLSKAMALDYANQTQEVTVGTHCWVNINARLCVPKPIKAGKNGSADIVLERFDLAMLKPFLTDETRVRGVFSGKANVIWKDDGSLPQAKVDLKGDGVKAVQLVDGTWIPLEFDTLTLSAALKNGKANLDWLFKIANNGQLKGSVQIADLEKRRQLSGHVEINRITLALIKPLLGEKEVANGDLNANLRLGGTANNPLLNGNLALSGLEIKSSLIPFDIKSGNLGIAFNGTSSVMTGQINTPEGYLNISGDADWRKVDAWRAKVMAVGNNLRVSMPPMVKVDVQPDIVFEASPTLLTLNGSVTIPWARITVQELPESAVGASSDVVMLDSDLKPIDKTSTPIPIQTNLDIKIGNDVQLDAFGLKARLTGMLKVLQNKQGLSLNGQIDIPSGRFRAYGQDLIVRKGQIQFSGPADQPFLNLEAIRNPDNTADNVIAGVKVTGLADKPKVEIFSEPAKTQQEALSYLLRGEGLESGDANGSQMTSMLIGLGVAQSGQLVGKIGETFGVSDLALDTQGVGDKSQVVVSGKITNDLQIKYGVGIFDSLATLTLRYRLMPKLYLEAVSGVNQALDLLYQFEF
ncbi:translocation/assembly module TamB domain-containing protein [Providencia vermicola]|uniref:Translocation/assembly module TamB n=1 Tax=Providencia vermicola TaxID=333965 RepID=A0AAX3RYW6_9GAMM|nr:MULTISPECIES: translocation/assembly module TamB domain-containing protein [Providencia]ELX8380327.1 translocation/assembly module TamB [Providencia stuartii]EMD5259864.1 translocation/assembly module TamB [Providencia stuartii]USB37535.1 translocation/assembly module TamB [Providencia vermicola]WFC06468.1 translocation/assembly module TamB [Providencia vermicola]